MPKKITSLGKTLLATGLALVLTSPIASAADQPTLLNSSYDIARELFADYNEHFNDYWEEKTGQIGRASCRERV